jgi:hypothetical protein
MHLDFTNWVSDNYLRELSASSFGMQLSASSMLPGCETWHSGLNQTSYGIFNKT